MAAIIDTKIQAAKPDAVLASLMSPEVAHLKSEIPLYLTTDATFPLLNEVYGSHRDLHPKSIQEATYLERAAFEKATKLILPLQWLADSAMKDYDVPAKKIEVIPYGPNLDLEQSEREIEKLIENRTEDKILKLLFVGVRWEEKGGPFAVRVLKELLKKGVDTELEIVGCYPELAEQPEEVKVLGFLDKENEEEATQLYQLYSDASFFIMPTKAECVGMSFIEAASFGLPAIGTKVGGVPEAILHKETGFLLGANATPEEVAEWIISNLKDEEAYRSLSKNTYMRYKNQMNWKLWGERVRGYRKQVNRIYADITSIQERLRSSRCSSCRKK